MRSPLDTSTLVLAGVAVVLAVVPRMVVALLLAGLMQVPRSFWRPGRVS